MLNELKKAIKEGDYEEVEYLLDDIKRGMSEGKDLLGYKKEIKYVFEKGYTHIHDKILEILYERLGQDSNLTINEMEFVLDLKDIEGEQYASSEVIGFIDGFLGSLAWKYLSGEDIEGASKFKGILEELYLKLRKKGNESRKKTVLGILRSVKGVSNSLTVVMANGLKKPVKVPINRGRLRVAHA